MAAGEPCPNRPFYFRRTAEREAMSYEFHPGDCSDMVLL
jgi:hypothetical protein